MAAAEGVDAESVDDFRVRARAWLAATMPRLEPSEAAVGGADDAEGAGAGRVWARARELQRMLFDGGFAGLCYPKEYGGQGLAPEYQYAFNEEIVGYEMPLVLQTVTFSISGPTILDMASEQLKHEHLPAILRGDEVLVQFLSEPRGGSDLAGATTRATRDGDVFVVNGSKVWSSAAYAADYALCLVRTDWDAPKHRGLTMLMMKVDSPGLTIRRIKQVNGKEAFCQEFFDDVQVPVANVIGEVNGGWAVASAQTVHERAAVGGASMYATVPRTAGGNPIHSNASPDRLIEIARRTGQSHDTRVRELVAEAQVLERVHDQLVDRVVKGMAAGALPPASGAIIRLFTGESASRGAEISLEIAGSSAVLGRAADDVGVHYLFRQAHSILGGTMEISRNVVSERVLDMPREYAADRDVPFNQVRAGAPSQER